jgi:hypothetical protein
VGNFDNIFWKVIFWEIFGNRVLNKSMIRTSNKQKQPRPLGKGQKSKLKFKYFQIFKIESLEHEIDRKTIN